MIVYQPGLHIIATLDKAAYDKLKTYEACKLRIDESICEFNLEKLGEVYHNFSPFGFTGVICLSESHISIHTWPEYQKVNLDIYLSNFQKTNDGVVNEIFEILVDFFEATISYENRIIR